DLTLQSNGAKVTIQKYAFNSTGLLIHSGTGTLTLHNLWLYGKYAGPAPKGGCVRSAGNVRSIGSDFYNCRAVKEGGPTGGNALGGAIYTKGDLYMIDSAITGALANGPGSNFATGGGAYVGGKLTLMTSTLSGNEALGYVGIGGAACAAKG